MKEEILKELFKKHIENRATVEERKELMKLLAQLSAQEIENLIDKEANNPPFVVLDNQSSHRVYRQIEQIINRKKRRAFSFLTIAAASLVLFFVGERLFFSSKEEQRLITQINDLPPGDDKAVLTLADGSTMVLDSQLSTALLADKKEATIEVKENKLLYTSKQQEEILKYNTLTTPKCGEYQLVLPDGTYVKLNAESSISFPQNFSSKERRVMVTGELYFEVKKSANNLPFIVECKNIATVEVLGTHFNINAYENEESVKTTLVEGSVRVTSTTNNQSTVIVPGQQAAISTDGTIEVGEVNIDEILAWKNGRFIFEKADIKAIMRQLERWYGIETTYAGEFKQYFGGAISRKVHISKIFEMFESTGNISFELEGNRVTLHPKTKKRETP